MRRGKLTWYIDVGDVDRRRDTNEPVKPKDQDAYAREVAEGMSDSNGGGWTFAGITDRFPHEDSDG